MEGISKCLVCKGDAEKVEIVLTVGESRLGGEVDYESALMIAVALLKQIPPIDREVLDNLIHS